MLTITNIKVYDLKESIVACRNSMRVGAPEYTDEEFEKGLERAKKLAKAGGGHNNFLKGVRVSFDMKYTQYITKHFQRYNWFDYVSSTSLMHRITNMDFNKCCNKYVTINTISEMDRLISHYNVEPSYEAFMSVISNCPMGAELVVRISTNYLQLQTIYHQRKTHKLREDYEAFKDFIESLPFAEELITIKNN